MVGCPVNQLTRCMKHDQKSRASIGLAHRKGSSGASSSLSSGADRVAQSRTRSIYQNWTVDPISSRKPDISSGEARDWRCQLNARKENATRQGGALRTYDKCNVAQPAGERQPIPVNVARLTALGVEFKWRKIEQDLRIECPVCRAEQIYLHESKPFHYCPNPVCSAWINTFDQVMRKLETLWRDG
jgi:hypothetical protein